jgi:hypothetical protein
MSRAALWSLAAVLGAAACSGEIGIPRAQPAPSGAGGSGGSGGSGAGAADNTPALPISTLGTACNQPNLGQPALRLLNRSELEHTLADVFPQVAGQWSSALTADFVSKYGFDNDASVVVGPQAAGAILDTATAVATAVTGDALQNLLPCASSQADRSCAEQFLSQYGRRLFRRALTQEERDRYLGFFDGASAKSDFRTALKWMTVGLIQSPHAVYRREIGELTSDGTRQLSPQEVATELAYTYTGTAPNEDLLTKAENAAVGDPVAFAKGVLATDQGKQMLHRFFSSWLGYERATAIEKASIGDFASVRGDMVQETRAFVESVVMKQGGGLVDLLTSPTTTPSQRLAGFYGFPSPAGDYASIARPTGRGVGILAQGSVLSTRAQPNASSPTQRGILVFERLLCQDKPSPPPNVPPISQPQPGQLTTRARYENQHAQGACAGCHKHFDPIGFGFEHFDEAGRYRADEGGLPIDSASNVPGPDLTPLFQFADEEGLVQGLAQQPLVFQCFTGYLATYAFGTPESCLGAAKLADLVSGAIGISDYFASLAAEPHFTRRSAE